MKLRWTALFAIALLVACGGSGPSADEGKTPDEIRKIAADMSVEDLEKVIKEYTDAINAEKDDAKLKDLQQRAGIYGEALTKKKMPGGMGG